MLYIIVRIHVNRGWYVWKKCELSEMFMWTKMPKNEGLVKIGVKVFYVKQLIKLMFWTTINVKI